MKEAKEGFDIEQGIKIIVNRSNAGVVTCKLCLIEALIILEQKKLH